MQSTRILTALCTAGLLAQPALAADDMVPTTNGFSGNLIFGAGYVDIESNLIAGNRLIDVANETVSSVFVRADGQTDVYPFVTGEIDWAFGDRWQVFFGNDLGDLVTLDFSQRLGIRKEWDGVGVVGVSALLSGIPGEVWEDPYLAGTPRRETDRDSTGVRFDWWRILGSEFFLQLRTREIDIDNELSGTDPALGLTAGEIAQLRRDGDDSRVTLGYRFARGSGVLQPEITIGENDRDGDALSADVTGVGLSYSHAAAPWRFVAAGTWFQFDYDAANPIYGRKLDSDTYTLALTAIRRLDFGDGGWGAFGNFSYGDENSDVDFHDASGLGVNLGLSYRFGPQ